MAIADEVSRIKAAKENIKQAIIDKGVEVPETTLDSYPELIEQIKTQGKYQVKSATPTKDYQVITPDEGYDALERVLVAETPLETTTITPSTGAVTVVPKNDNIGFSEVTVNGDPYLSAENIKKGVSIFGVTGIYEGTSSGAGDLTEIGTTVTVEAANSFNAGERFVGVASGSPTILSKQLGAQAVAISDDCSVFVYSQTLSNTTTSIKIGLVDENFLIKDIYIDIPTIPDITTMGLSYQSKVGVNEDGTYVVIGGIGTSNNKFNGFLLIDVDKENQSGSATFIENFGETGSVVVDGVAYTKAVPNQTSNLSVAIYVYGKQILVGMQYLGTKADGTTATFHLGTLWSSSATNLVWYMKNAVTYNSNNASRNGDYINVGNNGTAKAWVVNMKTGAYVENSLSGVTPFFSRNGKYAMTRGYSDKWVYLYSCTPAGLTLIGSKSISALGGTGNCEVDSSGDYFRSGYDNAIYKFSTGTKFSNAINGTVITKNFEISQGKCCLYYTSAILYYLSKDTVEYRISNTGTIISTADRIYGITNKAMTVGETGTAQALFRIN